MEAIEPRRVGVRAEVDKFSNRENNVSDFPRGLSRSAGVGRSSVCMVCFTGSGAIS